MPFGILTGYTSLYWPAQSHACCQNEYMMLLSDSAVAEHFSKPGGENWSFDFREQLESITCPTLIAAGDIDPVTTLEAVEEMAAYIPYAVKQFEFFKNSWSWCLSRRSTRVRSDEKILTK